MPDAGINHSRGVVEWKRGVRGKGLCQDSQAAFAVAVFLGTVEQLSFDDRAKEDVRWCKPFETGADRGLGGLEVNDPGVGIEEKGHHHSARFSKGSCGGRSNGSPANAPAVSWK